MNLNKGATKPLMLLCDVPVLAKTLQKCKETQRETEIFVHNRNPVILRVKLRGPKGS